MIGGCNSQRVVALNVHFSDNGSSLVGTMTYAGESEARVRSERTSGVVYDVNNHFGDPLQDSGAWVLGTRGDQPIGLEATVSGGSAYIVKNQWGSRDIVWLRGGVLVLGNRMRTRASQATTTFGNSVGMQFKLISAGKFAMDSPDSEAGGDLFLMKFSTR